MSTTSGWTRREALKLGAGALAAGLVGNETLSAAADKVVVIGAGVAGLAAARSG